MMIRRETELFNEHDPRNTDGNSLLILDTRNDL